MEGYSDAACVFLDGTRLLCGCGRLCDHSLPVGARGNVMELLRGVSSRLPPGAFPCVPPAPEVAEIMVADCKCFAFRVKGHENAAWLAYQSVPYAFTMESMDLIANFPRLFRKDLSVTDDLLRRASDPVRNVFSTQVPAESYRKKWSGSCGFGKNGCDRIDSGSQSGKTPCVEPKRSWNRKSKRSSNRNPETSVRVVSPLAYMFADLSFPLFSRTPRILFLSVRSGPEFEG